MSTTRQRGVTASEFLALCKEQPQYPIGFSGSSIVPFLERCREVGFLSSQVGDQGRVEYSATASLRAVFYED